MTWSIDAVAARNIISSARATTEALDAAASAVAECFADAGVSAADAPLTAEALRELAADPFLVTIAGARRRIAAVTDTADTVIDAYVQGDVAMAAQTQSTMATSGL